MNDLLRDLAAVLERHGATIRATGPNDFVIGKGDESARARGMPLTGQRVANWAERRAAFQAGGTCDCGCGTQGGPIRYVGTSLGRIAFQGPPQNLPKTPYFSDDTVEAYVHAHVLDQDGTVVYFLTQQGYTREAPLSAKWRRNDHVIDLDEHR